MDLSLQSGGTAFSELMWPNLLTELLDIYNLRGTFLILGGMLLNNLAFAIIFANCHNEKSKIKTKTTEEYRKVYVVTDCTTEVTEIGNELDLDMDVCKPADLREVVNEHFDQNSDAKVGKRNNKDKVLDVLETNSNTDVHYHFTDSIEKEDVIENDNNKFQVNDSEEDLNVSNGNEAVKWRNNSKRSKTSLKSLNECDRRTFDDESQKTNEDLIKITKTELRNSKQEKCSWKILLSVFVLAGTLNSSTLSGFVTVYQDINVFKGLTIAQSDLTFMSYALLNVLSRFLPILPAKIDCISSFAVPLVTSLCGATGQIIFLTTSSLTGAMVAMGFTGISDGGLMASMQAIMFEPLPEEKQAVGFGVCLTAFGIAAGATGPILVVICPSNQTMNEARKYMHHVRVRNVGVHSVLNERLNNQDTNGFNGNITRSIQDEMQKAKITVVVSCTVSVLSTAVFIVFIYCRVKSRRVTKVGDAGTNTMTMESGARVA